MATEDPFKNLKGHPNTYIVQDQSSQDELTRVDEQDRMYNEIVGGVLPEQPDPSRFQRVLDVGCGSGRWLVETAKTYPTISQLVGVDISVKMLEYAQAQAETAGVSDRVKFQTGNGLIALDFPEAFFDLVNMRLGMSWVRKWDWPKLLHEYQRVAKPGGMIRITEVSIPEPENRFPATARLMELICQAFYQASHFFAPGPDGVIAHLAEQMSKHGIIDVQTRVYDISFHKDPQTRHAAVNDVQRLGRTFAPFIRKWVEFSDDYDALYRQVVQETQQPDFELSTRLLTAWGRTPES